MCNVLLYTSSKSSIKVDFATVFQQQREIRVRQSAEIGQIDLFSACVPASKRIKVRVHVSYIDVHTVA